MQPISMESLFQKGYVYGDLEFGQDSLSSRTFSVGWETDVTEYGTECLISEKEIDSFIEGTHSSQNCCIRGNISVGGTLTAGLPTALSVDDGLSTKFSSPFSEFDCQDSALINQPCYKNFKLFQRTSLGSSAESSPPVKCSRSPGLSSQAFVCQVHGCNKDLSSSKDYHKRHRVCDNHSKTAKVIVDGIERRFCQQCSRFHLLGEFDEGKRSCRRRLAGHNERRRKPKAGNHCWRNRRFRSYKVDMFDSKASSISNQIFHADPIHSGKVEDNNWNQQIKAEYEAYFSDFFSSPQANGNLHPTGMISFGKQYPFVHGNASNEVHEVPEADLQCSYSSYTLSTSGKQDSNVFCTESNLNGVSTIASPSALSLLSSQNSPNYSTGIPMTHTWGFAGNPAHCSAVQVSDVPPETSHELAADDLNPGMNDFHSVQIIKLED